MPLVLGKNGQHFPLVGGKCAPIQTQRADNVLASNCRSHIPHWGEYRDMIIIISIIIIRVVEAGSSESLSSSHGQEGRQTDRQTDRTDRTRPDQTDRPDQAPKQPQESTDTVLASVRLAPNPKKPYLPAQGRLTKNVRVTCSSLVDKRAPPPPATGGHAEACPRCPHTKDPGRPEGPRAPSLPEGCGTLRAKSVAANTKTETEKQEREREQKT